MSLRLIECVPNISEGRDRATIDAIAAVVETVDGVRLLDVDPGNSTHRTVITFVGPPETIVEAAFRLMSKAAELIDMSKHRGEHPRMGATDVCPFVPVAGVTMEDCKAAAHALGERVGKELGIPGYFYEDAALTPERQNLAHCRKGEYEGLEKARRTSSGSLTLAQLNSTKAARKTGATAIGARDFLVAYNVNLNTTSSRRANAVAFDLRENGRVKREGGVTGPSGQRCSRAAPAGARHAQMCQGHWLVHRRIRDCPIVAQPHQHFSDRGSRRLLMPRVNGRSHAECG